jgi:hypothetical protein
MADAVHRPVGDDTAVETYIASLDDEQTVADSRTLIEMMHRISGQTPQLWNVGTIGFDTYHYRYESGREGDATPMSFYPRKGKLTIYLMDGTSRYSELLARMGKHATSRVCLYIKRLSDVDLGILEQVVRESYEYVKSQDGRMYRVTN